MLALKTRSLFGFLAYCIDTEYSTKLPTNYHCNHVAEYENKLSEILGTYSANGLPQMTFKDMPTNSIRIKTYTPRKIWIKCAE